MKIRKKKDMGKICLVRYYEDATVESEEDAKFKHEIGILLERVSSHGANTYSVFILSGKYVDTSVDEDQIVCLGDSIDSSLSATSLARFLVDYKYSGV